MNMDSDRNRSSRWSAIASRMRISAAVLAILAVLLASLSAAPRLDGQNAAALKARLQAVLDAVAAAAPTIGVTAGVVAADGVPIALSAGLSDREAKTPMKPSDRLLMGSVGKTYVAAVALQLLGEGKIRLEDKIAAWLGKEPWFPRLPNGGEATIRHLMTHTSGLVRYEFQEKFTVDLTNQPAKVWTPQELLSYVLDLKPPFLPGQQWEYSDTNYIVLGLILEKAGGAPYYDLLRNRILGPLKLADTVPSDSRMIPGLVQGYAGEGNPFGGTDAMIKDGVFAVNPQFEWTGGGLACSAVDLARWAKLLYEGKAFAPELVKTMIDEAVPARLGRDTKYGLGVIVRPTPLGMSWGHSGFFPGYLTEMMYFPEHKLAVAVQFNSSVPRDIGKAPLRVLLDLAAAAVGEPPAK
jgi:D-alanyl-D-alanine carboxypeptidase